MDHDVAKVGAVRDAVGNDVRLCVDANTGWTVTDAINAIRTDGEIQSAVCRAAQFLSKNPRWMAEVRRRTNTPIAAHESIFTLQDAVTAMQYDLADIWAITPSTHGGLLGSRKIMALAEAHGVKCLIGSTMELGIATAALIHLAVSTPILDGDRYPSDIIGPLYHEDDVIQQPIVIESGHAHLPNGPGLGVRLDKQKILRYRRD